MPFNPEQLSYAGRHAIDFFLRNDPIDQVNIERPLFRALSRGVQNNAYGGALQYVVEQLRHSNDSNFQAYFGDGQVTFNRKRTLEQAKFSWGSFHDGFGLNEDELAQNGITMTDDRNPTATEAEKVQLTNLFKENMETLKLGFQENFDLMLHRDGTQNPLEIPGLDALVALDPTNTIGTLSGGTYPWWKNYVDLSLSTASFVMTDAMEAAWRACIRIGGQSPNLILAGEDFIDAYRRVSSQNGNGGITRQVVVGDSGGVRQGTTLDSGVGSGTSTGLFFKGVPIMWDPVFEVLDDEDSPTTPWTKRCYFLNKNFLKLRPIKGHWMVPRKPPRVYDRYVHYWAITAKASLTTGKRSSHAVLSVE